MFGVNLQQSLCVFCRNQRSDFKSEPCKLVSLTGCAVVLTDETLHSDVFQIVDYRRSMYKKSLI